MRRPPVWWRLRHSPSGKIENASAYQAAGIYGLLRTHERLDAGEPTEIHAHLNIQAVASLDKLAEMLGQSLIDDPKTIDITPTPTTEKPTKQD